MIPVNVRNETEQPIRITIAVSGSGRNDDKILITIGSKKPLKSIYGHNCVEQDLEADKTWREVGTLELETKYDVSLLNCVEPKKRKE